MPRTSSASYADPCRVANGRPCDQPGCDGIGEFRAPRSRATLHDYFWFCLDHVRSYNASWNYYAGMSPAEVEREIRRDVVWQRPSWPLGSRTIRYSMCFKDYGMFNLEDDEPAVNGNGTARYRQTPASEARALAVFELSEPVSLADLKARYKALVKLNHPDAHGGDKAAEERLKVINQAYSTLRAYYTS